MNKKLTFLQKIKEKVKNRNFKNDLDLHKMMVLWIGNVCPRSFAQLDDAENPLLTAVQRIAFRTAFEIPGWQRILPIRDIFDKS